MPLSFFDMLHQICYYKSDLNFEDDEVYKAYDIYMINRYLSMIDVFVPFVFEVNKATLDKPTHYLFFKNIIPKGRYDFNYIKKIKDEELNERKLFLCKYYEIGMKEASIYYKMLTEGQVNSIIDIYKYGRNGKSIDGAD
jgi:hypothetical protein